MRSQIASGAGWMLLFKLIDRTLGLVSTIILARLLVPADFGLVAMAMSVIGIIELSMWLSFDVALIQRAELKREHYDTAWTLGALVALACGATIAALSIPTAHFYDEPRLTVVMLVLAAGWVIGGLENVGIVDFRRQLDFRREFRFMVTRRAVAFIVTTILALTFRTYWALIIGAVTGKCAGVLLSYAMHPYRPRVCLKAARDLLGFSGWILVTNVINALQAKAPDLIVGRLLGASPLGVLAISTEIAQLPSSDLIAPINRAVFPGYSRMARDPNVLRTLFLDVVGVIMLLAVPAAAGIAAVADPLVRTVLGDKWLAAIPVIQVLALRYAVAAATSNNNLAYLAIGRPGLITSLALTRLALLIPLAIVLARTYGLIGVAIAELASTLLLMTASLPVLFTQLKLPYSGYFARVWRPLLAAAIMAYAVMQLVEAMPGGTVAESGLALAVGVGLGMLIYPTAIVVLWAIAGRPEGAEAILYRRLQAAWASRTSRA